MPRNYKKITLADIQKIAKERGGECLAEAYNSTDDDMRFRCASGHEWETRVHSIKYSNSWCPQCRALSIEEAHEIAKANGGKCLSTSYTNAHEPLQWECGKGHRWEVALDHVKNQGTWCRECAFEEARLGIDEMHKLAESYGGKCLSSEYKNNETKLRWQCSRGHEWMSKPTAVKYAHNWCQECPKEDRLKELHEIAQARRGKLLEDTYINSSTHMKWECLDCNNQWKATPSNIKRGKWCPHCRLGKLTLADLINLARENNGECLSKEYLGWKFRYHWRCQEGHEWQAYAGAARKNWCTACRKMGLNIQKKAA